MTEVKSLTFHDAEQHRKIANRLLRAHGQLAAAIAALEADASCDDVVYQLSAVSKAVDRAGFLIVSTALKECLENPNEETKQNLEKLEDLFLRLS